MRSARADVSADTRWPRDAMFCKYQLMHISTQVSPRCTCTCLRHDRFVTRRRCPSDGEDHPDGAASSTCRERLRDHRDGGKIGGDRGEILSRYKRFGSARPEHASRIPIRLAADFGAIGAARVSRTAANNSGRATIGREGGKKNPPGVRGGASARVQEEFATKMAGVNLTKSHRGPRHGRGEIRRRTIRDAKRARAREYVGCDIYSPAGKLDQLDRDLSIVAREPSCTTKMPNG